MKSSLNLRTVTDGFEVEYEIFDLSSETDERRQEIAAAVKAINEQFSENQLKIDGIDTEIDRLTNHADGIDYIVAVGSGVLTGIIDSLVVGAWDFKNAKAISDKQINDKIIAFAKKKEASVECVGENSASRKPWLNN